MTKLSKWSQKRLNQIGVITLFNKGEISRSKTAELAKISERQVTRIAKEVKDLDNEASLHKNSNRKPANSIDADVEEAILKIYSQPEYKNVNFAHFCDSLKERHGILIPYPTLVSILKRHKKESPKKKKRRKIRNRRPRRNSAGELIQIDATPFDWFRDGKNYSLHGAIDDATGKIVGLYICEHECRLGYFEVMRQCILNCGVPLSIYSDNHAIFRHPKEGKQSIDDLLQGRDKNLTQFGRAMDELGVNIIYAKSAQAKGRVERMWSTLQSRLPVEFKLDGIKTVERANEYLQERMIHYFNQRWAVKAESEPIFIPLRKDIDIDTILCLKKKRSVDNAGVFSYSSRTFQIVDEGFPIVSKGNKIDVLISVRIGIMAAYKGKVYRTIRYIKPVRKDAKKSSVSRKTIAVVKPHLKHSSDKWKEIWHAEEYNLSLKFLYDLFLTDIGHGSNIKIKKRGENQ
jgi:hypothetical protein